MNLKILLKRNWFPGVIVTVGVDDTGNIQNVSCCDSKLLEGLNSSEDFNKFVKDTFVGRICSNQIDLCGFAYKIEQLP